MIPPQFADVVLGLERRTAGEKIARHRHFGGYIAVVVSGSYIEAGDDGHFEVGAGSVVFHGAFHAHCDRIGKLGAVILNVALPWWFEPSSALGHVSNTDCIVRCAKRNNPDALLRLLADTVPVVPAETDWPHELSRAINLDSRLSLSDWAACRGLSLSQLSRGFSQIFGVPAATYRVQVRARKAWRHIVLTQEPLADIAAHIGFADQPHMNRAINQLTGLTPGQWRRQICSRLSTPSRRDLGDESKVYCTRMGNSHFGVFRNSY